MNIIKNILWAALPILVLLAILDYFNLTGWFLFPVTSIRGKLAGKTDATVSEMNSDPATA